MNFRYLKFENDPVLNSIIDLGDKNSKTLGLLPRDAFKEYAKKGGILVIESKEKMLAGYCLFRKQKRNNYIKIAQLCVSPDFRGQQIADQILSKLKTDFKGNFRGIALNCREDYKHATNLWKRNHFYAQGEKPGRGKANTTLIQWLFNFNPIDLFNSYSNSKIRVLIDINIIIKWREQIESKISIDNEISYLFNDDIRSEVDYCYANESLNEIIRDNDEDRKKRTRKLLGALKKVKVVEVNLKDVYDRLIEISPPKNENDKSDRRQISEAIINDISYFITTDENLRDDFSKIEEEFNISILSPSQFIIKFDQIQNSDSFLPRRLGGTRVEFRKLLSSEVEIAIGLFFKNGVEKKSEFKIKMNELLSKEKALIKVTSRNNNLTSLIGTFQNKQSIHVQLIRINDFANRSTLFSQHITEVIKFAPRSGCSTIKINSSDLDEQMINVLRAFNFFDKGTYFTKIVKVGIFETNDLLKDEILNNLIGVQPNQILTNEQKYSLERVIFPGKISDFEIQNLIIPIKPYWAGQLFDDLISGNSLFGASEKLVWNRKNVYYRSTKPDIEKFPARIFWYVSSGKNNGSRTKGIVACSYLEDLKIDLPKPLFAEFKRIGIYEWQNIFDLAKNDITNLIKVIEFADTEVFEKSIPLSELQLILKKKHTFQSPLKIDNEQYFKIYQKRLAQ